MKVQFQPSKTSRACPQYPQIYLNEPSKVEKIEEHFYEVKMFKFEITKKSGKWWTAFHELSIDKSNWVKKFSSKMLNSEISN